MRTTFDVMRSLQRYFGEVLGPTWDVRIDEENSKTPFCRISRTTPVTYSGGRRILTAAMGVQLNLYAGKQDSNEAALFSASEVEQTITDAFLVGGGTIDPPSSVVAIAGTGGTLSSGTYHYQVTSAPFLGESLPSDPVAVTLSATGSATVTWGDIPGARLFGIYREGLLVGWSDAEGFTDTGITANANHAVPAVATAQVGATWRIPLYDYATVDLDAAASDTANRPGPDFVRVSGLSVRAMTEPEDATMVAVVAEIRVSWLRTGAVPSGGTSVLSVTTDVTAG